MTTTRSVDTPAAKKAKIETETPAEAAVAATTDGPTGWEGHTMNISEAVMKADEGKHFESLKNSDVSVLQGIGPFSARVLDALHIKTVKDLAKYKFFHLARALAALAETETEGGRLKSSVMNIDKAVDKEWESKTLTEILEAPTEALEGVTKQASDLLESLGAKTIGDLATLKYCRWAEAIVEATKYENLLTAKERKVQAQLKKLS
eukprot:CAMPEP_0119545868 /NCGR_PEP_ID=MMETSP1352-20130426/486_1 /TAXON_ID=265584 /ORGANISM="Stauroneis constricta, Strain CCMP1120" /LENGTH=205 /DNA_ID=CAMNT_0007590479 /DNA_START=305 /DNA_END=922 /DNA_ORIENTATION=+